MFEKVSQKTVWQKCAKNIYKSAPKMFAKVHQKSLQKCAKMFEKVRQKTVWQKCAQNVCKSVPKMLSKSVPKIFAKVCQKCLQKCAKNVKQKCAKNVKQKCTKKVWKNVPKCLKKCAKKLFGKSVPKIQLWDKDENILQNQVNGALLTCKLFLVSVVPNKWWPVISSSVLLYLSLACK